MAQKQCGKCGEMVEQAKAFCPGCGHALVEEEVREATNFERMDNTVQLGQTMYNQMLSDMGLSKEKRAEFPEKRIEVIEPAAAPSVRPSAGPASLPRPSGSSKTKWIILGVVILLVGLMALVVAGLLLYFFWPRIS